MTTLAPDVQRLVERANAAGRAIDALKRECPLCKRRYPAYYFTPARTWKVRSCYGQPADYIVIGGCCFDCYHFTGEIGSEEIGISSKGRARFDVPDDGQDDVVRKRLCRQYRSRTQLIHMVRTEIESSHAAGTTPFAKVKVASAGEEALKNQIKEFRPTEKPIPRKDRFRTPLADDRHSVKDRLWALENKVCPRCRSSLDGGDVLACSKCGWNDR